MTFMKRDNVRPGWTPLLLPGSPVEVMNEYMIICGVNATLVIDQWTTLLPGSLVEDMNECMILYGV